MLPEAAAATSHLPTIDGGSSAAPAHESPVFGLNVDLVAMAPEDREATVGLLAGAGIRRVRQPVRWAEVEPVRGEYDWSTLDRVARALDENGIKMLAALQTSPDWARSDDAPPEHLWVCDDPAAVAPALADRAPPTEPRDLAEFAAAFVVRYEGSLCGVEVWPEPNLLPNWRATGPDPESYAEFLSEVALALGEASPNLAVVSGGLAPTTDMGVCYMSDVVYLDRVARTGVLSHVDAVGIEPYGLRTGPGDPRRSREVLNFGRAEVLRHVLEKRGVDLPLWAVAWGWNALPEGWTGPPSPWGSHSPEVAASYLGQAFALAGRDWPWLEAMYLWQVPPGTAADDPQSGFALHDSGGDPTRLWEAATRIAAGSELAPPEMPTAEPARLGGRGPLVGLAALLTLIAAACLAVRPRLGPPLARRLDSVERLGATTVVLYAAAIAATALWWPASLVALPVLVLLAAAHRQVAVAAVGVCVPFYYAFLLHLGPRPVWPVELLVLVAFGGWLVRLYAGSRGSGGSDEPGAPTSPSMWDGARALVDRVTGLAAPLDWVVVCLVLWAGLSLAWSDYLAPALREWRVVIVEPVLFYLLLRSGRDRLRIVQAALDGLVLGAVLASSWGLLGLALHVIGYEGLAVAAEGVVRANGPYASPNNLALFLGRLMPLVAAFGVWGVGTRRRAYALALLPVLLGLLATFSRGAILVGVPVTIGYLLLVAVTERLRLKTIAVSIAAATLVAILLFVPFMRSERLTSTFDSGPGSTVFIRLRLWESAVEMGKDHPVLGVGLDNFLYQYRDIYVKRDAVQERFLSHPHNALLDWWTRLGLVGVGLFAALVVGNLRIGLRAVRGARGGLALVVGALGMQIYALAHGLVDNSFFLVDLAIVWFTAQAALLGAAHKGRLERD